MTIYANKTSDSINRGTNLGRIREMGIFVGVVKDNVDAQNMGRISVYIPELGGDPTDRDNWFIVGYASPFAGATRSQDQSETGMTMSDGGGQMSYGFWMQPPDLDNNVLVAFANGDVGQGYWFACLYQQNMNHMVPAIASGKPNTEVDAADALPPVIEYNKAKADISPTDPARAVFEPLHEGLTAQGLYQDAIRGPSTTSVRREAPSKAYGWNTPRGNTVHVDDNPENEFIRMRTRSGVQILIHETDGSVYINSKEGNSWVSIADHGVDVYSKGSVSLRSEGSMNLHADGSLNIEADGNLNLRAGGNFTVQAASGMHMAANGGLALNVGGKISGSGSSIHLSAGGELRLGSGGDMGLSSGGANIRSASIIRDNVGAAPAPSVDKAEIATSQELPEVTGSGPRYEQTTRRTIVRRMPTHEPYAGHNAMDSSAGGGLETQEGEYADANAALFDEANALVEPETLPANISDDDADWLAICLFTEAAGESNDGKAAVAQVIQHRLRNNFRENAKNPSWQGKIKQYVLAYAAFSYFWSSDGRRRDITGSTAAGSPVWRRAEMRGLNRMRQVRNTSAYATCKRIAQEVLAGTYRGGGAEFQRLRATRSANWYVNLSHARPNWLRNLRQLVKIGGHTFFFK